MKKTLFLLGFLLLFSCKTDYYAYKTFTYPKAVDTKDKKIERQEKKVFKAGKVYASNQFNAARLNDFKQINDTLFEAVISPENTPINMSPWFAFRIWSENPDTLYIRLRYTHGKHRYIPKFGEEKNQLKTIQSFQYNSDSTAITFPFITSIKPQYIAAQEIIGSGEVQAWMDSIKKSSFITEEKTIGESVLGRAIPYFRIGKGLPDNKKVVVLMSRQHPPEISGFKALQFFIDELLKEDDLTNHFFEEFDIWVFPLLNPDGVDLGHWRHNAHGIDLNRDWAEFNQPETKQVTKFIREKAKAGNNKIILGIDFHSTQEDVYYVFKDEIKTVLNHFRQNWTSSIDRLVYPHKTEYAPFGLTQAISKNWFYNQFGAEAITYEMGDEVSYSFIRKKSRAAAVSMMDLLMQSLKK